MLLRHCFVDVQRRAVEIFESRVFERTWERNGVMSLLVTTNRQLVIYGDVGIHQRADDRLWERVRDTMLKRFGKDEIAEGVCVGIAELGAELARWFPVGDDDVNELSNEVIHADDA